MNKKIIFFLLGLFVVLILANFYFMNQRVNNAEQSLPVTVETTQGASETPKSRMDKPGSQSAPVATRPQQQTQTAQKKHRKTSQGNWQKPAYTPTEEEQARAAILATMTPEERQEAQKDLYKMSMFYRSAEQVDQAIEAARKNGNTQVVEKLKRFRMLAYPMD